MNECRIVCLIDIIIKSLTEYSPLRYALGIYLLLKISIYIIVYIMPARRKQYTKDEKIRYYKRQAAKNKYVKGHGAYRMPRRFNARKTGAMLGSGAGAMLGNFMAPGIGGEVGSALGGMAGKGLGSLFKSITGWGDYTVKSNSLLFPDSAVPSFGEDTIRVKKREFIAAINSTEANSFDLQAFDINPGLNQSFPWLSAIAQNYEQYRINGMIFQFVSTSSDAIASTTQLGLGQVIMSTDYSARKNEQYQDAPQMLGSMFSNSGKPSENIMHAIECAPTDTAQKLYYVRTGAVPDGEDQKLYDLGKFQIALNAMPAAYPGCGQLWVSYDITFCKSVQNNQLGYSINTDFWKELGTYNPTAADPFGTALAGTNGVYGDAGSDFGCRIDDNTIYFPEHLETGYYQVTIIWSGTAAAITAPTLARFGCEVVNCFWSTNAGIITVPANGVTSALLQLNVIVKLNDKYAAGTDEARLTLSGGTYPSTITRCTVLINQVNGEIFDNYTTTP